MKVLVAVMLLSFSLGAQTVVVGGGSSGGGTNDYNALINKPTIPAAQVQTDWNASSGLGVLLNKPTIPTASSATPLADGTATAGTSTNYAREGHVHPSDTTKVDKGTATWPSSGTVMVTTTAVQASQMPALTSDVTSSSGAVATTVAKVQGSSMTVVTALGTTGTVSMDFSLGHVFTMTPTGTVTLNATNCATGRWATIIVSTSGTTSYTITPSTNMKGIALSTGTVTAKTYGWSFVCNGTTAVQMSAATAAM